MKVSVVLPTNRVGGLDLTFRSLGAQTMPKQDWELVLIDDYPVYRANQVYAMADDSHVTIQYLKSKPNYWRSNRLIANARNTGLMYVRGELIVFLDDYTWVPPNFLEQHYNVYKRGVYTLLGRVQAVKHTLACVEDYSKLPSPDMEHVESSDEEAMLSTPQPTDSAMLRNLARFGVSDTRGLKVVKDCGGQWFYTSNASAPLEEIIQINGFCEMADNCSEEDIDLGLRLQRVGCRFVYDPGCVAYHMNHSEADSAVNPLFKLGRYKVVTYDELRARQALDSNPDEIQLLLKEKYGVKYDGSWGLHELNRRLPVQTNVVDGKKIFDLRAEREKRRLKYETF